MMDMMELLTLAVETHDVFDATDEDIFESVTDAKKLQERNGGDDDNDDINMPAPSLTRSEALQALLTLRKYIAALDDPFACKLEVMLGSFGQWTRVIEMQGMEDTKLTDYFPHK
ncbi:hypothetical protein PAXRUDRAFT_19069 [Paxillus rubicundulus Ve08.2h10]|uniref:Unplaced genomic scaffold scaffold_3342, whole genome shotgun sequence n=1 Tax=Paxillus rubicundulus Ve08.2h10 TaxID=930991 RepID=A0A0D0BVC7_9AGAM|nr:hypothetical protein PAXRUDRAFT_19069 [Paxillus rubicundulus Ve08.2h10]